MDIYYQLYSSRNFGPLGDTLPMLAELGYTGVEGYGALFADHLKVADLQSALAATGLTMPSGHFGLDVIETDPDKVIETAQALGIKKVFCPHLVPEARPTDAAGWAAMGARLAQAAIPLQEANLVVGWHNHDFEFLPLADGSLPMDALLSGTSLTLEFDIAWAEVAGMSATTIADFAKRHAASIVSVHVKDVAPAGANKDEDGWADLGQGRIDWATYLTQVLDRSAVQFIMEHDNPSDDERFARNSIAAFKTLTT